MSVVVNGKNIDIAGIRVKNYVTDEEVRFVSRPRRHNLRHIVIHETAGRTQGGCVRTLRRKKHGVHCIIDRAGLVTCHGDLLLDRMIHANQLNNTSVGIEIVNPYAPSLNGPTIDSETIPASWWTWTPDRSDKRYVTPTGAQIDALVILVPALCHILQIPYEFPTWHLNRFARKIPRWRLGARPDPGVVAHRDFGSHADGRWPLEQLILASLFC